MNKGKNSVKQTFRQIIDEVALNIVCMVGVVVGLIIVFYMLNMVAGGAIAIFEHIIHGQG